LKSNLGGEIYHSLFVYVRPANRLTITVLAICQELGHPLM